MQNTTLPEWLSLIADLIGILGAVFALFAWRQARQIREDQQREQIRQNQLVQIKLQYGKQSYDLPVLQLRRGELTRAEILGRIGMIPMRTKEKGKRFEIRYVNTAEFLQQINQILDGNKDGILTIPCTEQEFNQFDL
ncbi:MAG: hypothetical protein V9E94_10730 [Microthrixaceae bacterium]